MITGALLGVDCGRSVKPWLLRFKVCQPAMICAMRYSAQAIVVGRCSTLTLSSISATKSSTIQSSQEGATLMANCNYGEDAVPISQVCQRVSEVIARIGDKWRVLVVMRLSDGPRRFNVLRRMIGGISQRLLAMTLRGLERDGLVKRTVSRAPHRVEYELTALGYSLREPLWWRSASGRSPTWM